MTSQQHTESGAGLGRHHALVDNALEDLDRKDVVARIWRRDHTVWKEDPREITNRLGWLTAYDTMAGRVKELEAFAREVRDSGFQNVVLLGMGGSSLGPEVIRQTMGSSPGYPAVTTLDSTVPAWVQRVTSAVDPARTLFIVSSKSGGTTETLSYYSHFRKQVEARTGLDRSVGHFVAITDAGTPLERLGQEQGFRKVFLNQEDLGGRYSVLSHFGLVSASLAGLDIKELLGKARAMQEQCSRTVAGENPGARLGAVMGALARAGRDKLTILTSPSIGSFGLWVEQLIAESTGKEGKGIIPVAGEPILDPDSYGDDRLFVYVRLAGDQGEDTDPAVERLRDAGQPVVRLDMEDAYDLGAEFYRWEFATAVAGSLVGIHPFDQPNVQGTKDMTDRMLEDYQASGQLSEDADGTPIEDLLSDVRPGDYFAITPYLLQTPELDQALAGLRRRVMRKHRIATTLGYGPRYLHSTGQLHKGGPNKGIFLQITAGHSEDLPIPGAPYSFGVLANAQALGDLEALRSSGRRAARCRLEQVDQAAIGALGDRMIGAG